MHDFTGRAWVGLPPRMKGLQGAAGAAGAAWAQEGGALARGGQTVRDDTFPRVSALTCVHPAVVRGDRLSPVRYGDVTSPAGCQWRDVVPPTLPSSFVLRIDCVQRWERHICGLHNRKLATRCQ